MYGSQKKNFLFFLLIVHVSLSAGLKQRFFASLPRIVLATQVANYIAVPLVEGISEYRDVQKNLNIYADPDATKYVTSLLRERKVIKPHETVPAQWSSRYATYCGTLIEIPREPESITTIEKQGVPAVALLHEEKHRQNQDFKKRAIVTTTLYAVFWGLGTCIARKAIFAPSLTIYESLGRTVCASYIPTSFMGFLGNPLIFAYNRHQERMADRFAVKYAKNPEELEQTAAHLQKKHAQSRDKNENIPPIAAKIRSLVNTHPSELERAQYFQKAAAELRAKQKTA